MKKKEKEKELVGVAARVRPLRLVGVAARAAPVQLVGVAARAAPLPPICGAAREAPVRLVCCAARVAPVRLVGVVSRAATVRHLVGNAAREATVRQEVGSVACARPVRLVGVAARASSPLLVGAVAPAASGQPRIGARSWLSVGDRCSARRSVPALVCKNMDVLGFAEDAASLFRRPASHPFVYLARMLQTTCQGIELCTSTGILLTVTASQVDFPGDVLLFASDFLDRASVLRPSAQVGAQLAVGVDSIVSAVREVVLENMRRAADGVDGGAGAPNDDATANGRVTGVTDLAARKVRGGINEEEPNRIGNECSGRAGGSGDDEEAVADDHCADVGDLTGLLDVTDEGDAAPGVTAERTREQPARPTVIASAPREIPPRSNAVADSAARASGNAEGRTGASARALISDYVLPSTFVFPGLTVAPERIQLPSIRVGVRCVPPHPAEEESNISDLTVQETIKQLKVPTRVESLRSRLVELTS